MTLRAPLPPQPAPVLPHGAGQRTTPKGEGRAERRAHVDCGRRSPVGRWRADELLAWSAALNDELVTFDEWRNR